MRVAMLPDWRQGNPYQALLAEALAPLGVEAVFPAGYRRGMPLSRALLPRPRPDLLHLHWPTPYLRSGRTVPRAAYCLRTLADLALGRQSGLTDLPWVNRRVRKWEPEPLRWLALHGMYALMAASDRAETRTGRESRLAALGRWVTGRG